MKTNTIYFYLDNTKEVKENGLLTKKFTVIEVPIFNNNIDEGNRKARTVAKRLNIPLAGGYFGEGAKPYNFSKDYKVISCPKNTKIDPLNDHDKFIINLIESGY